MACYLVALSMCTHVSCIKIISLYKLYKILLELLKCFTNLLKFLLVHMALNKKLNNIK